MTSLTSVKPGRSLSGPERVAALLLSVDKFVAQRVLKHFDQNELRQITKCAAGLGAVPASAVEPLIEDLMSSLSSGSAELRGTAGEAERLLTGVIPAEQVAEIMSDVLGSPNGLVWERVGAATEAAFAEYVVNEHPQTTAVVLSRIDPARAAATLATMPAEYRDAVMRRMLSSNKASDQALRLLEMTLQEDLLQNSRAAASASRNARLAAIINKMEREQAEGVLRGIAATRPREAEALREMLFSFEDIVRLNVRARMILFDVVPADRIVLALRGAETTIKELILSTLSLRMRRMVESELASGASPPHRDIATARRQIAETVLTLAEQGKIDLTSSAGEQG